MKNRRPVIHPIIFALFPTAFLLSNNYPKATLKDALLPGLISILAGIALWVLLALVVRNVERSGVICSVFLLLFFSYGRLYDVIAGQTIANVVIGRHLVLMPVWGTIFLLLAYSAMTRLRKAERITKYLNATALLLLSISLVQIGYNELRTLSSGNSEGLNKRLSSVTATGQIDVAATCHL